MGSNLRMTKARQEALKRDDNKAWRPEDIGTTTAVTGTGYAGWLKNATPAQRQLNFDPDETEVASYKYSEVNERFDPEGKLTEESDAQHQNVPDKLAPIPPPLTNEKRAPANASLQDKQRKTESAAQKARWRGWSEVLFKGAYGNILQKVETQFNNMFVNGQLAENWKLQPKQYSSEVDLQSPDAPDPMLILGKNPKEFGATFGGAALTEADLKKISDCWYPVHAMGYNWLQSNGTSAKKIAERITGLIKGYRTRGFDCTKVIVVTHSMGGLVARALVHPNYGNLQSSILGMYHNVMPTIGAGAAYKRLRFGFHEPTGFFHPVNSIEDNVGGKILSPDGQTATAILANAQGPLEMLPANAYGPFWLQVLDQNSKKVPESWPGMAETSLDAIYTQPASAWWRLINPMWINPKQPGAVSAEVVDKAYDRLREAHKFSNAIEKTFHPVTYASWCDSSEQRCYENVVFKITDGISPRGSTLPPAVTWTLLADDGKGELTVLAGKHKLTLTLQPGAASGDGTVPAARSAQVIRTEKGGTFVHGRSAKGYVHQDSYSDEQVLASTLYAIAKIAMTDRWGA